jgi:signal transduction histidine kinase
MLIWREPPVTDDSPFEGASLPHVNEALASGKPTVSGMYRDPLNGRSVVSAALPIRDASGSISAVIGGDIDLLNSDLQRMATATGLGPEIGDIQILDAQGIALASSVPDALLAGTEQSSHLTSLLAAAEPVVGSCDDCRRGWSRTGGKEIVAVVPMSFAPWYLVLWEGEADVLGPAQSLRTRFTIAGLVIFSIGTLVTWALAQSVVRPVQDLTDAAQRIAGGRLTEAITISGEDEVGRLGQALDTMRRTLRNSLVRIHDWNRELEKSVRERTQELEASRNRLEESVKENRRLYEELQQKEALRGKLLQKLISVEEEERRRMARELHDETSQALATLILSLETTSRAVPDDDASLRDVLRESEATARSLLESVHRLIFDLRPSVLDDLGLVAAVRWYGESRLAPMGTRVHLETDGRERRLPSAIETAVFRVTQEALTNVARHAEADNVAISLSFQNGTLRVELEDDGKGFDVAAVERSADSVRGLGLLGMRERVALLDGTLAIDSSPESGTTISIEVPVPPEGDPDGH